MELVMHTENLVKTYGAKESITHALCGVDLNVYRGEILTILGSSGSGKSTLLNMLGGMDIPTSGKVFYHDISIGELSSKERAVYRRKQIGFVFQQYNLISDLTAGENIHMASALAKSDTTPREMLAMVGLEDKVNVYPAKLSGGEQQRVSIARALAKKADILLCDEPTGALDFNSGKQILKILESLSRREGQTVVIVTHTKAIADMADRVIYMRSGKIMRMYNNANPISADEVEW